MKEYEFFVPPSCTVFVSEKIASWEELAIFRGGGRTSELKILNLLDSRQNFLFVLTRNGRTRRHVHFAHFAQKRKRKRKK